MEEQKNKNFVPLAAVAAVLVAGGIGTYSFMNQNAAPARDEGSNGAAGISEAGSGTEDENDIAGATESKYRNGTYTATGDYVSPGGQEQVGVELTIENDVVTDASFTPMAFRPISINMQGQFAEGYKAFVVGKRLDEISVTKVSGSSLTPQGFMDAVAKIKAQAS